MTTVGRCLESERQALLDSLVELDELYVKLVRTSEQLLDVEVACINVWSNDSVSFYISEHNRETPCKLLDLFNLEQVRKQFAGRTEQIEFESDNLLVTTVRSLGRNPKRCRKYLVTEEKTLTVCGELDESRYVSVTPLDEEDAE